MCIMTARYILSPLSTHNFIYEFFLRRLLITECERGKYHRFRLRDFILKVRMKGCDNISRSYGCTGLL